MRGGISLAGRMFLSVNHIRWELKGQLRHLPVMLLSPVVREVHSEVMDENLGAVLGKMTMQRKKCILQLRHGFE